MSVCDGRPPRPNPEPWPEGRVPTNNLERLIASAPRPPEKPPAAPKAPDSHVIPPPRGTGSQQEVTRLDILSLIHSQCHRVYASAIDREDIDTKYMAEIEEALRAVYADAELASRGRAQGGNTSENSRDQNSGKSAETRMGSGFEGGPSGTAPAAGTDKDADLLQQVREAVTNYYRALDARKHGGSAQDRAFMAIESALGMSWNAHIRAHKAEKDPA